MPTLRQLHCTVECIGTGNPLSEYNTIYGDGKVETYIAVPEIPTPFAVRLRSMGWIASGLAMFVYIDGEYQCNRNRQNLCVPKESSSKRRTEINFFVRQKETALDDGTFAASPWKFEKLNSSSCGTENSYKQMQVSTKEASDELEPSSNSSHNKFAYKGGFVGTVEVVVLRCFPRTDNLSTTAPRNPLAPEQQQNASTPSVGTVADAAKNPLVDDQRALMIGGGFNGARECSNRDHNSSFGIDGSWDGYNQGASSAGQQQWGFRMTGPNTGVYQPLGPATVQERHHHNKSLDNSNQDWPKSHKGSPQISPHGTPQMPPPPTMPPAPAVVINVTHGVSQPPPQWIYPGDTGASVSVSSTEPNTPQENIEHIHELPQNQDAGGWLGYGQGVSSNGNGSNSMTSEVHNVWSSYQPKKLGIPGAWIDVDQDDGEWTGTGNSNEAENDQSGRKNDENTGLNRNNDCNNSSRRGWQNDNSICSNKDNNNSWNINHKIGEQTDIGNDSKKNKNDDSWKDNNDSSQRDIWKHNSMPQKDWIRESNMVNFANANSGNTASINNKTWDVQDNPLQDSQTANDISNTFRQSLAHDHKSGCHKTPTKASQVVVTNQMVSDPTDSTQPQRTTFYSIPPAESHDSLNILEQPQGIEGNLCFRANVGNTISPLGSVPKPLDSTPNPYWGQWNSSHQPQNPRDRSYDHHSPRAGLVPTVLQEARPQRQLSHQVRSGKPLLYAHKVASPDYMDTHELPYAVFVFHYRSKELLEETLNVTVMEPAVNERERLKHLSKEEIIEYYLHARETTSIREQPVPKANPAPKNMGEMSLSEEPAQGSTVQNQMGIGIDMSQIVEYLGNMQVGERTRDPSISANPTLALGNNTSAPNKDPQSQSGSPGKSQGTALTSNISQGTSGQWGEADINIANGHNSNWGGESPKGGRSVNGNANEPVWEGAGQSGSWGNEKQAQTNEASHHGTANLSWGNEGQVKKGDGGWDNTGPEQNQGVAW